ncbi:MAG: helix-turn-helix domain-containing protein [Pseudomonadota bacterium]|nr:helix-turn-helix domain-containing protein [Pseudomonadota bacterium]
MNTGAATGRLTGQLEEPWEGLTVLQANRTEPLSECVRNALRFYLRNLDGYEVNDLHEMVIGEVERPLIEIVLEYTQGNQTQGARMLGMSRSTLRKKIAHYGVGR